MPYLVCTSHQMWCAVHTIGCAQHTKFSVSGTPKHGVESTPYMVCQFGRCWHTNFGVLCTPNFLECASLYIGISVGFTVQFSYVINSHHGYVASDCVCMALQDSGFCMSVI